MKLSFVKVIVFTLVLVFTQSVFAAKVDDDLVCPSVNAINSKGVDLIEKRRDGTWIAYKVNQQYDTNDHWDFGIYPFKSATSEEALAMANKALSKLVFSEMSAGGGHGGPIIICWYDGISEGKLIKAAAYWRCNTCESRIATMTGFVK